MSENFAAFLYLVSGVLFIMALRGLSHPTTSRQGNTYGMVGMGIAIVTTLLLATPSFGGFALIVLGLAIGGGAGAYVARSIPMTSMPQLVAGFHSLVGLAAVLVAAAALYSPSSFGIGEVGSIPATALVEMSLGVAIGAITFTGSIIAFLKLDGRMSGKPIMLPARHMINIGLGVAIVVLIGILIGTESYIVFWLIVLAALALGVLLIVPIGGADMPVVVSMLNSYSGWAAAGIGFTLGNLALIITGALVGSSGAILSYIMCKGMNRSFISVILGGFGGETAAGAADDIDRTIKQGSADDAAFLMANASKVIIVPGYGMAVAQAQHALRELADALKEKGVEVKYAIHPGRRPHAGSHERASGRGQRALRRGVRTGRHQLGIRPGRCRLCHRRQRRHQPCRARRQVVADLRYADPRRRQGADLPLRQTLARLGLCRHRQHAVLQGWHDDAARRRQEDDGRHRQGARALISINRAREKAPPKIIRRAFRFGVHFPAAPVFRRSCGPGCGRDPPGLADSWDRAARPGHRSGRRGRNRRAARRSAPGWPRIPRCCRRAGWRG
jgi:NAD(P) transhydrogenase subunit beta